MSSVASYSTYSSQQQTSVLVSPPPSPRMQHFHQVRPMTIKQRLQQVRRLPEYDSRDILADPLQEYSQPIVLFEEKHNLEKDIESLKAEVLPLREQANIIGIQFEGEERDPVEEVEERALMKKIEANQEEIDSINRNMKKYRDLFTEECEEYMKGQVQDQRHEKSDLEAEIEEMTKDLYNTVDDLAKAKKSPLIEKVKRNDDLIDELQKLLEELRNEEKELLSRHEKMLDVIPTDSAVDSALAPYIRKLQQTQHIKNKRSVENRKILRSYETQKKYMESTKAEKQSKERELVNRQKWQKSYKTREAANEMFQKQLAEEENAKSESSPNCDRKKIETVGNTNLVIQETQPFLEFDTVTVVVRHKHKHRHYHHKNEEKKSSSSSSSLSEKPPESPTSDYNAIMFKTELENTKSLHTPATQ